MDDDSRQMFDNAAEYALLYPQAVPQAAHFCAPRLEDGEALEALRSRLAALAGMTVSFHDPMPETLRPHAWTV